MNDHRQRDPEATKQAILEAAERVIVEKGFGKASVAEIASVAGVTKSLIHHHFHSKEKLWDEVKRHRFREYAAVQKQLLDEPGFSAGLLRRSIEEYFRFLARNPHFPRLVSWMHLEEPEDAPFELAESLIELGMEKVRQAQAAGELRSDIHPFFVLVSFLGLAMYWFQNKEHHCRWCESNSEARDDEKYLEAIQKIFFEGVLPREEPTR
jgi:TetR/AcrR family transcriptional regulator